MDFLLHGENNILSSPNMLLYQVVRNIGIKKTTDIPGHW